MSEALNNTPRGRVTANQPQPKATVVFGLPSSTALDTEDEIDYETEDGEPIVTD